MFVGQFHLSVACGGGPRKKVAVCEKAAKAGGIPKPENANPALVSPAEIPYRPALIHNSKSAALNLYECADCRFHRP